MMRALANGLDVKLEQAVAKIAYHDTGVTVTSTDGTTYDADIVVVTLPLGVLKARSVEFEPELPSWKTDAIDRLGFGLLNKLVMEFDEAWY
jgi:monoamine oxidase